MFNNTKIEWINRIDWNNNQECNHNSLQVKIHKIIKNKIKSISSIKMEIINLRPSKNKINIDLT